RALPGVRPAALADLRRCGHGDELGFSGLQRTAPAAGQNIARRAGLPDAPAPTWPHSCGQPRKARYLEARAGSRQSRSREIRGLPLLPAFDIMISFLPHTR